MTENKLVNPKEHFYFVLSLIASILLYVIFFLSMIGIFYAIFFGIMFLFSLGLFIGQMKGNAIKVSETQFPEIHKLTAELTGKMNMKQVPDVFIFEYGGFLNALATRFLGRNYIILYTETVELAYEKGERAMAFIIAHELAHLKRNHLGFVNTVILAPSKLVPFLGHAYSRACEYTCDRYGAFYAPEEKMEGMLALAAGKRLYRMVNANEFMLQRHEDNGFWVWLAEKLSTHPHITNRLSALKTQDQ